MSHTSLKHAGIFVFSLHEGTRKSDFIFIHSFIRSFNRQPGRRRRVKKMKRAGGRRWRREMKKGGRERRMRTRGGMKLKIRREGGERGRKKRK